ncbi:hypothetical protein AU210_015687 [Fusarium oxysporum f. sp. radicis-cucumerinum]|uniref:Uncharacterized protein n=1 Tax=Fusarium oxysporum f. sp. radicis-cucumerinum TaxID=327505 RepID=A0A2H3G472_FUSOX|nr:hypothetical protein AU210_015687 [Fusarium oxysporum f. sp. radicis-cucumerinum]
MDFASYKPDRLRLLYMAYKKLGSEIYAELDPEGRLEHCNLQRATNMIPDLVHKLPNDRQAHICNKLDQAIARRMECEKHYKYAPERKKQNHQTYISFLRKIQEQLSEWQQLEEEVQPAEETTKQEKETTSAEDERADNVGPFLTPAQLDFLDFLEIVVGIAEKAAALWVDVAHHKLPSWVASTLSNILLREAENVVNITRLLDIDGGSTPWDASKSTPQLTQKWVETMDGISDAGAAWHKLVATVASFWPTVDPFLYGWLSELPFLTPPYFAYLLLHASKALQSSEMLNPTSVAQVPFAVLVGVYFCTLVVKDCQTDGTSGEVNRELFTAERNALCALLDESQAILPRMIAEQSLTDQQADESRQMIDKAKIWARDYADLISLGQIHSWARIQWFHWHVRIVASNTVPLQAFLYLCEKQRLEIPGSTNDEYEHLLGGLMTDSRIAPLLLRGGRPTTVSECVQALQNWCVMVEDSDATVSSVDFEERLIKRRELVTKSIQGRISDLLGIRIAECQYGLPHDIRARVSAREGNDDEALQRYLVWETSAPNCLKLEHALSKTLRELPEWKDRLAAAVQMRLSASESYNEWRKKIIAVIDHGLHALAKNKPKILVGFVKYEIPRSFEICILKLALKAPGHEESLKALFTDTFRPFAILSSSYADELFDMTMQGWLEIFNTFEIESLSREFLVEQTARLFCLQQLSQGTDHRQRKKKIKTPRKANDKLQDKDRKSQSEVIGGLLKAFLEEARSVLEEVYGKSSGKTAGDTERKLQEFGIQDAATAV